MVHSSANYRRRFSKIKVGYGMMLLIFVSFICENISLSHRAFDSLYKCCCIVLIKEAMAQHSLLLGF